MLMHVARQQASVQVPSPCHSPLTLTTHLLGGVGLGALEVPSLTMAPSDKATGPLHVSRVAESIGTIPAAVDTISDLVRIRSLCLHGNSLSSMLGLEKLCALTELNLSANNITQLSGLDCLSQLRTLNVASNRLTSLDGLPCLPALDRFNCAHNFISSLGALSHLHPTDQNAPRLAHLDVRNNILKDLQELAVLQPFSALRNLYISGGSHPNAISTMSSLRPAVAAVLPQVRTPPSMPCYAHCRRV